MQSVRVPARAIGSRCSAIRATVFSALPGVTGTSPRSATDSAPKTCACCAGLYGRSAIEAERTASGPKRAPGRFVVPASNGIPRTATSTPSGPSATGQRANVLTPA